MEVLIGATCEFVQHYINICHPQDVLLGNDNDVACVRFNANYMGNLMDKKPTWEQENISFFLNPITGDKTKLHLDIEVKQPQGKDGEKFYNSKVWMLQETEGYPSKVGEALTTGARRSILFGLPFPILRPRLRRFRGLFESIVL